MVIAIVGSRTFYDFSKAEKEILKLQLDITRIVSGGANGADQMGELFANKYNIPLMIYPPNWDEYGKAAGFIRNKEIVKDSDLIIAFWDGKSVGTKSTLDLAISMGKPSYIVRI